MAATRAKKTYRLSDINYPYKKTWDINGNYVEFEIKNVSVSLMNSIRRIIIGSVPSVGFRSEPYEKSTINIIVNDSPLHNQFLSHRISMIPIFVSDTDGFNSDDWEFIIDIGNSTNFPQDVTTEHIKIRKISTDTMLTASETKRIFPPDPITGGYILLTRLKPKYYMYGKVVNPDILGEYQESVKDNAEEEVRLTVRAKAVVSNGLENGHFNPSACACHSYKIDPERAKTAERAYVQSEQDTAVQKGLTPYTEDALIKRFNTTFAEREYYQDERSNPYWFNFKIESVGTIPPLVIFQRALVLLRDKVNDFNSTLVKNDSAHIKVEPSKQMPHGYRMIIDGEDDTLGNLLQYYISDKFADINLEADFRLLNYVGYVRPHPLEMKLVFTIQAVDPDMTWSDIVEKVITPICSSITADINSLINELEATSQFNNELKQLNRL
jgi:DNA-directed RNA polymerase subunit L